MPGGVAVVGSLFDDGDEVAAGSTDVMINGVGAARLGDFTTGHTPPGHTFFPPAPIISGSGSVFANNLPLAAVGDKHGVHCDSPHPSVDCHDGTIVVGSTDVITG